MSLDHEIYVIGDQVPNLRANLSAFRTFVRFVLVLICRFPLPLGVWEGLRFVIVTFPGLFSYLFFSHLEINKTNILSKIHDDHFKTMTFRVSTRFSSDLAW